MYEGIGRPDLKPKENKMTKTKKELKKEFKEKWEALFFYDRDIVKGSPYLRCEGKVWSWVEKALQAKEEPKND